MNQDETMFIARDSLPTEISLCMKVRYVLWRVGQYKKQKKRERLLKGNPCRRRFMNRPPTKAKIFTPYYERPTAHRRLLRFYPAVPSLPSLGLRIILWLLREDIEAQS
jgi:hypothetical protein